MEASASQGAHNTLPQADFLGVCWWEGDFATAIPSSKPFSLKVRIRLGLQDPPDSYLVRGSSAPEENGYEYTRPGCESHVPPLLLNAIPPYAI